MAHQMLTVLCCTDHWYIALYSCICQHYTSKRRVYAPEADVFSTRQNIKEDIILSYIFTKGWSLTLTLLKASSDLPSYVLVFVLVLSPSSLSIQTSILWRWASVWSVSFLYLVYRHMMCVFTFFKSTIILAINACSNCLHQSLVFGIVRNSDQIKVSDLLLVTLQSQASPYSHYLIR